MKGNDMKKFLALAAAALLAGAAHLPAQSPSAPPPNSWLRPGDSISLAVVPRDGQPGLKYDLKINSTGHLRLPIADGNVSDYLLPAAGKKIEDLQKEAAALYARYRPTDQIELRLLAATPDAGQVTFSGAVQGMACLEHGVNTHLAQAVLFFSPSRFANLRKVRLNRLNPDGSCTVTTFNVEKIVRQGFANDIPLQAGDFVDVPTTVLPRRPLNDLIAPPQADSLRLFTRLSFRQASPATGVAIHRPAEAEPFFAAHPPVLNAKMPASHNLAASR